MNISRTGSHRTVKRQRGVYTELVAKVDRTIEGVELPDETELYKTGLQDLPEHLENRHLAFDDILEELHSLNQIEEKQAEDLHHQIESYTQTNNQYDNWYTAIEKKRESSVRPMMAMWHISMHTDR